MKIDCNQEMKDLDGEPLSAKDKPDSATRTLKLKDVLVTALCAQIEQDRGLEGRQAFERYELARKINAGGEIEFEPAQAAMLQDRVAKVYPVIIAGAAYEMLKG